MEKINFGKIVGVHGINGEVKVISDFERKDLVLKKDFSLYIDDKEYKIKQVRHHQNKELILFDNITSLNDLPDLRNKDIYIYRKDLDLKENEYLMQDLIGYTLWDNEQLGTVIDIYLNKAGYLLKVKDIKEYFVPFNDNFIKEVKMDEKKIIGQNVRGLR